MNGRCYVCVLLIEDQKLRAGEQRSHELWCYRDRTKMGLKGEEGRGKEKREKKAIEEQLKDTGVSDCVDTITFDLEFEFRKEVEILLCVCL